MVVTLLHEFGGLDPTQWPVTRSLGPMLLALGDDWAPIVSIDGAEIDSVFVTSIADEGSP
jgi:hypothetical protein